MSQNSGEITKSKSSLISRVLTSSLYGLLLGLLYAIISSVLNYLKQEPILITETFSDFVVFFSIGTYMGAFIHENIIGKLENVLAPISRKIFSNFHYWTFLVFGWFILLIVRESLLKQFPEIETLLDMSISYSLYALLISLCVFSLVVLIPTSKYLASPQINTRERKLIVNVITFLIPLLGFPWVFPTYFVWTLSGISIKPFWIIYVVFFLVYIGIFLLFVNFPYYSGARDKKSFDLEKLDKKRDKLLQELQNLGNSKNQDLLKKIVLESEIGRIDREKQVIESRSLHPFKLIIPTISLAVTIFVALLIELLKDNLPQLIGG